MGLDVVELVMEIETVFDIEIPDRDAKDLDSVALLYDYVAARVSPSAVGRYEGALWKRYLDVVEKETGCARRQLRPEARFVYDLGLD